MKRSERLEATVGQAVESADISVSQSMSVSRTFQLLLLTVSVCAGAYARTAVGPLQEAMRTALALSDNQIALLQGPALALPVVLGAIPLGLIIDRYSRARLLFGFAVLNLLGTALTGWASSFAVLFIARCLVGLSATAVLTTALSLVADLYVPSQRGRASVVIGVGQVAGNSAAFALGGLLLSILGGGASGWRWSILCLAGPLVVVLLSTLLLHEPARTEVAVENPDWSQACMEQWRYRAVFAPLLIGLVMVGGIAEGAALIWAAPTFARSFGLTPDRIGALMAMGLLISGVVGAAAGGFVADFCQRVGGPRRTMAVLCVLALLTAPAGLFAVMPNVNAASLFLIVLMLIGTIIGLTATTLCTIVMPNELRGLSLTVLLAAGTIVGIGLAPLMVSLLSSAMGGPAMIGKALAVVCVASGLLGAVAFGVGRKYMPPAVDREQSRISRLDRSRTASDVSA